MGIRPEILTVLDTEIRIRDFSTYATVWCGDKRLGYFSRTAGDQFHTEHGFSGTRQQCLEQFVRGHLEKLKKEEVAH